jgi:LPPG:FO 2-phospho-L-lactate transferase
MRIVQLSGGVGGARMARGFASIDDVDLTVVVNVGDDAENHGLAISPDLDTVVYTLAGEEGSHGWGRRDDTFRFNDELGRFGVDNTFRLGDLDLALKVHRTVELGHGRSLSDITKSISESFDLDVTVTPVTDDRLRTRVLTHDGWLSFQEYFVDRRFTDDVLDVRFDGAEAARPAPGVIEAVESSDLLVIGPSNPPLSIWPILAVPGIREAVERHPSVAAVSPLIGGKTVRGPADRVMESLGLPPGNLGVAHAYEGLVHRLFIDSSDAGQTGQPGVDLVSTDTLITDPGSSRRLAMEVTSR